MGRYKLIQEPQYVETLTCGMYHDQNKYTVVDAASNKLEYMVQEESSILYRCQCLLKCPPSARPWNSRVMNVSGGLLVSAERPCKCSFLCICRPEVIVRDGTNTQIGRIINPCPAQLCCKFEIVVKNEQDFDEYTLTLCICNYHVCCECCAGPCEMTDIRITPATGMDFTSCPASVKKYWSGFAKECYSAADEYEFDIPDTWNDGQKGKFIVALQFFDMLFFEQNFQCFFIQNIKCQCYTC
jgi:hypothetical protein